MGKKSCDEFFAKKAEYFKAVKTMAQTALSLIAVGSTIATVDWKVAFSSAIVAGVISLLTSIAGLPEVKSSEESTK